MCMCARFFHIVSNNNSFKLSKYQKYKKIQIAFYFIIRALLRTLHYTRLNQLQDRYISNVMYFVL